VNSFADFQLQTAMAGANSGPHSAAFFPWSSNVSSLPSRSGLTPMAVLDRFWIMELYFIAKTELPTLRPIRRRIAAGLSECGDKS
jgi:hypothetical protein